MLVSDDSLASIGSANIDFRSFECNFEINTFVYDGNIARQLKEIFMDDIRNCRQLTYKELKEQRSLPQRLKESVARLFSPIL
jgi:cardiolipin synthase